MKKQKVLATHEAHSIDLSDWVDPGDLSHRCHFVGFVVLRLIF